MDKDGCVAEWIRREGHIRHFTFFHFELPREVVLQNGSLKRFNFIRKFAPPKQP
jgi:hypothetical protein